MTARGADAAASLHTPGVLARALAAYREQAAPLFGLALAGAIVGIVVRRLFVTVPLLPWLGGLAVAALFHALLIRRLDRDGPPAGDSGGARAPGFAARVLAYALGVLLLDVAGTLAALVGLVAGGLLALLIQALGAFLPGPLVAGLVVFVLLLGPALPLVVISMGGVFVGFTSVLGGRGAVEAVTESFRIARRHWKLVGAVVTVTYGVLFPVDVFVGGVDSYYTLHHLAVHVIGPEAPRLADGLRRLLGPRRWESLPRGTGAPAWWVWLCHPFLLALPLPWALAASHVIYAADRDEGAGRDAPLPSGETLT